MGPGAFYRGDSEVKTFISLGVAIRLVVTDFILLKHQKK
jgi:hypothetical protein